MSGTQNNLIDLEDPAFPQATSTTSNAADHIMSEPLQQTPSIKHEGEDGELQTMSQATSHSMPPPATLPVPPVLPAKQLPQSTSARLMPPPPLPTHAQHALQMPRQFFFASTQAAFATSRTPLSTLVNDDFNTVKHNQSHWLGMILDAFDADFDRNVDESIAPKPEAKEEEQWIDWQERGMRATTAAMAKSTRVYVREKVDSGQTDADGNAMLKGSFRRPGWMAKETLDERRQQEELERNAWALVKDVLKLHEHGYRRTVQSVDPSLICSARLKKIIEAVRRYAIVREDIAVGRVSAMHDLVADPRAQCQRKVATFLSNNTKKETAEKRRYSVVEGDGAEQGLGGVSAMPGGDGSQASQRRKSTGGRRGSAATTGDNRRRSSAATGTSRPTAASPSEARRYAAPVPEGLEALRSFEAVREGQGYVKRETKDPAEDDETMEDRPQDEQPPGNSAGQG